jgi:hypothetical protein
LVGLVVLFTQVPLWTPAPFTTSDLDVVFMPCIDPRRASDNTAKPCGAMQRGEASVWLPRMNDLAILAEYQKIEGDGCCREIR